MALVERLADKLKIEDMYTGCHDKEAAITQFAEKHRLQLSQVCFIGDDVIDIRAMGVVGFAVAPADAHSSAKSKAHLITAQKGGRGAVREVLDLILSKAGS